MNLESNEKGDVIIHIEDSYDWALFKSIVVDAINPEKSLSERLSLVIEDPETAKDWRDFVMPDIQEAFDQALKLVYHAIEEAHHQANNNISFLIIAKSERSLWYSALNQARLALEDTYHYGNKDLAELDVCGIDDDARSAYLRSHFYLMIQSLLLDLGLD